MFRKLTTLLSDYAEETEYSEEISVEESSEEITENFTENEEELVEDNNEAGIVTEEVAEEQVFETNLL